QVEPVFAEDKQALFSVLPGLLQEHDLLLTLGAGDIGAIAKELDNKLEGLN
ncbi:MAG TPA: UDP-N-acetylmuramate--L-alanine ligase, partial [Methylophaga sp.]|nr:UDP-N-acetylmuramate--L-alanine ligase [Methylophaga sp.]